MTQVRAEGPPAVRALLKLLKDGGVVGIVVQLALVPILAAHWGLERYGLWGMLIARRAGLLQAQAPP